MTTATETMVHAQCRDLITEARACERWARELENGAPIERYGSAIGAYRASAARLRAEYHALRAATRVTVDRNGYVTAAL